MRQDGSTLTIPKDTFKYNRSFQVMCYAQNANYFGHGSLRIRTPKQFSKVNLDVEPANFGVSGITQFTFLVNKDLEKSDAPLFCEFFQRYHGVDVRVDDIERPVEYTKTTENIVISLSMSSAELKSENV
jgi:hypothetical protein